ncbi:MAG: hypothetical protein H6622_09815 [Halobacteriovoraceae bacterium]|nr:hypothetical protein [Halobacteriovoraceae bacterium]
MRYIRIILNLSLLGLFCSANSDLNKALEEFEEKNRKIDEKYSPFYDEKVDYSKFTGRVSDRDSSANILKIQSEYKNIKFFRAGDMVLFNVSVKGEAEGEACTGYVRGVENSYFILYVQALNRCWDGDTYFRRGTFLLFNSEALSKRIKDVTLYRAVLLRRRKDFLAQLNDVNTFVWGYDQERIKLAAEYDKKLAEIETAKSQAMDRLLSRKLDQIRLRELLIEKLTFLDKDLEHYRVDKDELLYDRWNVDHDLGKPVKRRPQKIKVHKNDYDPLIGI